MFNLLPQLEKKILRREYRIRIGIVALGLSFVTLLIASVTLVPSLLLSSQREESATRRFEALSKSSNNGNADELDKVLLEAKSALSLLPHESPKKLLYEVVLMIVALKTDAVSLQSFSFAKVDGGKRSVDIGGGAKDRAALLAFVKALEESRLFEGVDVPISHFAKDSDIEFSIKTVGVF